VGQDFTQVKAYISDKEIYVADVSALIIMLEIAFGARDCLAIAERKVGALKKGKYNLSTCEAEFQ
jgi:hypothetical protein